jgi:translation initiation factor 2 alpha subunit (eIF-2alpha)
MGLFSIFIEINNYLNEPKIVDNLINCIGKQIMPDFIKIKNLDLFDYKWHKEDLPAEDSIVIGRVQSIDQNGVFFQILDYQSQNALMPLNQVSSKRIRTVKSVFKEGDVKPVLVTKVDDKNGFIDISNKYVNMAVEDIDRLDKYIQLIRIWKSWILYLVNKNNSSNNYILTIDHEYWNLILNQSLWNYTMGDAYENIVDIRTSKKTVQNVFPGLLTLSNIIEQDLEKLVELVEKNINYEMVITIQLTLRSFATNGLATLQKILDELQNKYENCKLFINSPHYTFVIKSHKKEIMETIYERIEDNFVAILENEKDVDYQLEKSIKN